MKSLSFAVSMALLTVGCNATKSEKPFFKEGEQLHEPALEGHFQNNEKPKRTEMTVTYHKTKKSYTIREGKDELTFLLFKSGDHYFTEMIDIKPNSGQKYNMIARISILGNRIYLHIIKNSTLESRLKSGKLKLDYRFDKEKNSSGDVILTGPTSQLQDFISSNIMDHALFITSSNHYHYKTGDIGVSETGLTSAKARTINFLYLIRSLFFQDIESSKLKRDEITKQINTIAVGATELGTAGVDENVTQVGRAAADALNLLAKEFAEGKTREITSETFLRDLITDPLGKSGQQEKFSDDLRKTFKNLADNLENVRVQVNEKYKTDFPAIKP